MRHRRHVHWTTSFVRYLRCSVGAVVAVAAVTTAAVPGSAQVVQPGVTVTLPPKLRVALPQPLSTDDAARYRRIFSLQEQGRIGEARKVAARVKNNILMGHVLQQRFLHPTAYKSRYLELRDWMARYADHPDANRIYKLARKRKPKKYKAPRRPVREAGSLLDPPARRITYATNKRLSHKQRRQSAKLKRRIRIDVRRTRLSTTERRLASREARRLFDRREIDEGYQMVSAAWYYYGNDSRAYKLASQAAARSGTELPLLHWTAGLAAWRLKSYDQAGRHFEALARSATASEWNTTSGAYWAARVHEKRGRPAEMRKWLQEAAKHPRTFYGLLARKRLDLAPPFQFKPLVFPKDAATPLMQRSKGRRALALVQVGEIVRAERELMSMAGWRDPAVTAAMFAVSQQSGLAALGHRLAKRVLRERRPGWSAEKLESVLYPIPPWQPRGGYVLDRALIFGKMRQESAFNAHAKSPAGALGLMQLMPSTASFVARDRGYRGRKKSALFDPDLNIRLGQRYLAQLLGESQVRGDLFRLAAAYNGGPGNLAKWQRKTRYGGDPLLFIESLPSLETRLFIERVLSNMWIYRARLGQPAPSLDSLARGDWPRYQGLDRR